MNGKQRIRSSIEHRKTDRVPTHFEATEAAWENLYAYYDCRDPEWILRELEVDTRELSVPCRGLREMDLRRHRRSFSTRGLFGEIITYQYDGSEHNTVVSSHPLDGAESAQDIQSLFPSIDLDRFDYASIPRLLDQWEDEYAVIFGHWGPFQTATYLRSEELLYMDMLINPELAMALFEKMHQFEMEHYRRVLEAGQGRIDILRTHDDYGSQRGLLFSPELFDTFFAAHTRELVELAHWYGAFFQQHSCGAVAPLIDRFVSLGVDSLEPVQPVEGMDPESLGKRWSEHLCFCGGIDTQHLLPFGSRQEIEEEIRRYMDQLAIHGGYILYPSQAWESCVPPEHIRWFYQADRRL